MRIYSAGLKGRSRMRSRGKNRYLIFTFGALDDSIDKICNMNYFKAVNLISKSWNKLSENQACVGRKTGARKIPAGLESCETVNSRESRYSQLQRVIIRRNTRSFYPFRRSRWTLTKDNVSRQPTPEH